MWGQNDWDREFEWISERDKDTKTYETWNLVLFTLAGSNQTMPACTKNTISRSRQVIKIKTMLDYKTRLVKLFFKNLFSHLQKLKILDDKYTTQAGLTWRPRPSWRTTVSKRVFKIVEIHGDVSFSWSPWITSLLWLWIRKIPGWSLLRFRVPWRGSCPPNVGIIMPIIPIGHLDCSSCKSSKKIKLFLVFLRFVCWYFCVNPQISTFHCVYTNFFHRFLLKI